MSTSVETAQELLSKHTRFKDPKEEAFLKPKAEEENEASEDEDEDEDYEHDDDEYEEDDEESSGFEQLLAAFFMEPKKQRNVTEVLLDIKKSIDTQNKILLKVLEVMADSKSATSSSTA